MNKDKESYATTIAKLLRKAESTTPEEADALLAKAQELMTTYAIDEALLARARGENLITREEVTEEVIRYHSVYSRAQFGIGAAIARHNECQVMVEKGKDLMRTNLWLVGFPSDIERVKLLNASVQIQAMVAMNEWYNETPGMEGLSQREKFKQRRQFLFSFGTGVQTKLSLARTAGQREASRHEAERANVSFEKASESVELVLADKKSLIQDHMDRVYGDNLRKSRSNFRGGSKAAADAGRQAGLQAEVESVVAGELL